MFQARNYLDPSEIFKGEPEEMLEKTKISLEVCQTFRGQFEEDRKNISKFFKEGQEVKSWEFASNLVFTRLDKFIERLQIVEVCVFKLCCLDLCTSQC